MNFAAATAQENGSSNSRSQLIKSTWGLDTCAVRFHKIGAYDDAGDLVQALNDAPGFSHGRGKLLSDPHPSGWRFVWYDGPQTLTAEGRLVALSSSDSAATGLAHRSTLLGLPGGAAAAACDVLGVGADGRGPLLSAPHTAARIDTTGELEFETPTEGLAFLRAVTGITPPRYKCETISNRWGQPETVYTITPRRATKVARFYDAGAHHGTHDPGLRIRYEVQNRFPSTTGLTPAALAYAPEHLPTMYGRHLQHFTAHAREINVTTAMNAPEQVARLLADGEITSRQALGLAGFAAMLPHGGRHLLSDYSANRYLRLLRSHGVVLSGTEADAALTIGQALDRLLAGAYAASSIDQEGGHDGV